jgi:hypothetical protein
VRSLIDPYVAGYHDRRVEIASSRLQRAEEAPDSRIVSGHGEIIERPRARPIGIAEAK